MLFISLIPQLKNFSGHFFPYQKSIFKALEQSRSLEIKIFMAKDHTLKLQDAAWIPFYRALNLKNKWIQPVFLLFEHMYVLYLSRKTKKIIYLDTFGNLDFMAFFFAIFFTGKKKDQIWCMLRYDLTKSFLKGKLIYFFIKLLKVKYKKKLKLFTETIQIKKETEKELNIHVTLLPIPYGIFSREHHRIDPTQIKLWWPGRVSHGKGKPEILQIMQRKRPYQDQFQLYLSKSLHVSSSNIKTVYLEENLNLRQYQYYMNIMDVILLPYHPSEYRISISGVFIEVILAGRIPFVRKGTWLSDELKRFGLNSLIVDWDSERLFLDILDCVKDVNIIKKLNRMKEYYRGFHSQKTFAEILKNLV